MNNVTNKTDGSIMISATYKISGSIHFRRRTIEPALKRLVYLLTLIIIICVCKFPIYSQVKAGVNFGLNYANDFYSNPYNKNVTLSTKNGFIAGGLLEFKLSDMFYFQPEFYYGARGSSSTPLSDKWYDSSAINESREEQSLKYFSIPLLFKAKLNYKKFKPYLYIGPNVSVIIKAEGIYYSPFEDPYSENLIEKGIYNFVNLSLDLGGGLEYAITPKIDVFANFKYNLGISDINKSDLVVRRLNSIQVTMGFKFNYSFFRLITLEPRIEPEPKFETERMVELSRSVESEFKKEQELSLLELDILPDSTIRNNLIAENSKIEASKDNRTNDNIVAKKVLDTLKADKDHLITKDDTKIIPQTLKRDLLPENKAKQETIKTNLTRANSEINTNIFSKPGELRSFDLPKYNEPFFVCGYYRPNMSTKLEELVDLFDTKLKPVRYIEKFSKGSPKYEKYKIMAGNLEENIDIILLNLADTLLPMFKKYSEDNDILEISFWGFADPRPIKGKYIEEETIQFEDKKGKILTLRRGDNITNEMLSGLRAWNGGILFDSLLREGPENRKLVYLDLLKDGKLTFRYIGAVEALKTFDRDAQRRIKIVLTVRHKD